MPFSYLLRVQLILLTLLLLLKFPSFDPQLPQVPYSDFIALVENGKVDNAIVGDNWIEYVLKTDITHKPTSTSSDNSFAGAATEQVFATTPVALDSELPKILRTWGMGQATHHFYASDRQMDAAALKKFFREAKKEGEAAYKAYAEAIAARQKATEPQIKARERKPESWQDDSARVSS